MDLGNVAETRIKLWSLALILFVVLTVSSLAFLVYKFKSASFEATVRTGFSEVIGRRLKTDGEMSGVVFVPIDPMEWGGGQIAEGFAESINELQPGEYRYVVYLDGEDLRFIVFTDEPELISSGFVPDDLMTD